MVDNGIESGNGMCTTYPLDAANEEGFVLEVQRQTVHVVNAAHKEILVQRQVPKPFDEIVKTS